MNESSKKTILLVEDEAILAISEKMSLQKLGYGVVVAHSGERAIKMVNNGNSLDLILMDIDLGPGGIDGTEAARIILQERDIPVVFLSSHTEPEIVEKTEKITSYGYVVKNAGNTVIDASIKMAFKLFRAATELAESRKKYRQLFEHSNSAVALHEMIYDNNGKPVDYRFIAVNPAFEKTTGLKAQEVVNRTVLELLPNTEQLWIDTYGTVVRTGAPAVFENYTRELDRFVEVTAFRTDKDQFAAVFADITDHKRMENALKDSEEQYRRLFETMSVGVVYQAPDGTIVSANPAAEKILGLTVDQITGKTSMDPRWKMINEQGEQLPGSQHPAMQALRTGSTVGPVDRGIFVPERNEYVWLSLTAIPLFKPGHETPYQVYATFEDITRRKTSERALRDASEYLHTILETTMDGVLVVEPDGRISLVNDSFCRMCGYTRRELIGISINRIDAVETPQETEERIQRIMKAGSETFETKHLRKDGTLFDVEVKTSRLDQADGVRMVTFCRDVSERKRAEDRDETTACTKRTPPERTPPSD